MTPLGLLLLTGGRGRRLGAPKHTQPHPQGGTWGSHVLDVFRDVFPEGPVRLLGAPLPDRPQCQVFADQGLGPAAALIAWASVETARPSHWWLAACDQVRWTPGALAAWHARALAADPGATRWIMARAGDHDQYLGSFLPGCLLARLPNLQATSLRDLAASLPREVVAWPSTCWEDVDTPEALEAWLRTRG